MGILVELSLGLGYIFWDTLHNITTKREDALKKCRIHLCRFFDKVIEKQFYGRAKPGSGRVSVAAESGGGGVGGAAGLTTAQDRRRVLM